MSAPESSGKSIMILKEGTERSQGRDARNANIMAARIVSEAIKTSLGPKGMDIKHLAAKMKPSKPPEGEMPGMRALGGV